MIVEKLPGTDARLYALVAPLVMSVPIIRQNNIRLKPLVNTFGSSLWNEAR